MQVLQLLSRLLLGRWQQGRQPIQRFVDCRRRGIQQCGDFPDDTRSSALVEAVVRMAEALDVTVVAEGVETAAQVEHLVELGCHRIQGFAVSEALSPDELARLLRAAPRAERSSSRGARR